MNKTAPLGLGVGGPVGSGKTSLIEALCLNMRNRYKLAVVTNDIYTREDQDFLIRRQALSADRITGVNPTRPSVKMPP